MSSDRLVRQIVREELAAYFSEASRKDVEAVRTAALRAVERWEPDAEDGPMVAEVKQTFRDAANRTLGRLADLEESAE